MDATYECLTAEGLSEKVGELEARARRLATEEAEELLRGRALNIITGSATPIKSAVTAAAAIAAAPPVAAGKPELPEGRPHGKGV